MIRFERLQKQDIPSLLELYQQFYEDISDMPHGFTPDKETSIAVWSAIDQTDTVYFAAKDGERVVSTCYISIIPNLTHNATPIGFIENVITDKDYRQQGLAERLVKMAVEYGKSRYCHKLVLLSGSNRKEAHRLYKKLGFDGDSKRGFVMRLEM